MASNQILAQIGVFALLGLNVGAYYVFWPHREGDNKTEAKAASQEKGVTQLVPEKKDKPALPKTVLVKQEADAAPLPGPNPPKAAPMKKNTEVKADTVSLPKPNPSAGAKKKNPDDPIARLLEHIEKETGSPRPASASEDDAPTVPEPAPELPMKSLDSKVDVTPTTPPKNVSVIWDVKTEISGARTKIVARLKRSSLEFTIVCDRIEMQAPGGTIQAIGKVAFQGAGVTGTCNRLSLPLHETRLTFQEQVEIIQNAKLASSLSGERIVWDLPAIPVEPQTKVAPVEYRPIDFIPAPPSLLGRPK